MNLEALEKVTEKTDLKTGVVSSLIGLTDLDIKLIYPNPDQPRKNFDEEKIKELAESIKIHGLLEPIIVIKDENKKYMIVAGERRYKAHLVNQAKTVKAIVKDGKNIMIDEVALIENIQRDDLTPFEIASSIKKIWDSEKYKTKTELAKSVGKSKAYISKAFAIFNLNKEILKDLKANKTDIGLDILQEISKEPDLEEQLELYEDYLEGNINRQDIRTSVKWSLEKLEEQKEFLDNKEYETKIKELIYASASCWLCEHSKGEEYAELRFDENDKRIEKTFRHPNDFKKIKEWKNSYDKEKNALEKAEKQREKLNDEDYAKKVKDSIFAGEWVSYSFEYVDVEGKGVYFLNENDKEKIEVWVNEYELNKEDIEDKKLYKKLVSVDYESCGVSKLSKEIIRFNELIKKDKCKKDDETYLMVLKLCKDKTVDKNGVVEDDEEVRNWLNSLVKMDFELSQDEKFIFNDFKDSVIFFTQEKELNIFKEIKAPGETILDTFSNQCETSYLEELKENDRPIGAKLQIISSNPKLIEDMQELLNKYSLNSLGDDLTL